MNETVKEEYGADLEPGDARSYGGATAGQQDDTGTERVKSPLMTTAEAAQYMRRSVSWLLRQPDVPYLQGKPNLYARADLDDWYERSKLRPKVQ